MLGAGGAGDVADVLDRRLTLMVRTFIHPVYPELLVACIALLVAGAIQRRRVLAWFGERAAARAGYFGRRRRGPRRHVANDSGSVLLVIGTIYLAACAGFYWATSRPTAPETERGYHHRVRVAIVTPYSWTYPGGVNGHVDALAAELMARGHELRVLAPTDPPDRLSRVLHRGDPELLGLPELRDRSRRGRRPSAPTARSRTSASSPTG